MDTFQTKRESVFQAENEEPVPDGIPGTDVTMYLLICSRKLSAAARFAIHQSANLQIALDIPIFVHISAL